MHMLRLGEKAVFILIVMLSIFGPLSTDMYLSGFTVDIEHQDNNLISGTISFGGGPELEFRGLVIGAEDPVIQFGIRDIQGNIISGVMVCNGSAITMNLVLNHNSSSLGLITTLYFEE